MRTLVRAGRRGVLVRIEGGRKGTHFLVGGSEPAERETFFDLEAATRSFEAVERGSRLRHRSPRRGSIVAGLRSRLPELAGVFAAHGARKIPAASERQTPTVSH
jgi:hypothetical protein